MKDKIRLITVKNAQLKRTEKDQRYYVSLELSYIDGIEIIFLDNIFLGNYLDFSNDDIHKHNILWSLAMSRLHDLHISLDDLENIQKLVGHTFNGITEPVSNNPFGPPIISLIQILED